MTRALLLGLALVATAAQADEQLTVRLHAGAQVGFPHIVGVTALGSVRVDGVSKLDVDLLWEPSAYVQSYSLGVAWRPVGILAVGPRLRALTFGAPWSRDVVATVQTYFGLGLDLGVRVPVADKGLLLIGAQATWVPAEAPNLQLLIGLSVGFVWGVADFKL
jgi:hypothetical protein